jgi:D-amino-acid oxidase
MKPRVAVIGAGVSGLTSGVLLAEHGFPTSIFARHTGRETTSAAAAAIWFPYDAEPAGKVIPWALETYLTLLDLRCDDEAGISMIELRQFSRTARLQIPEWAVSLGARAVPGTALFSAGFAVDVPVMDTTFYLDYLASRFHRAGGEIHPNLCFEKMEEVDSACDLVINCAGLGARTLAHDVDLEPHRGQVVIVPKIGHLAHALACDEAPFTYVIPRRTDCVFGGTNDLSENLLVDPDATERIVDECSRVLNLEPPRLLAARVGLRPFRKSGVRLERARLNDGRTVIHNYGHGGAGFTLSWGFGREVLDLALIR